ncbi:MAG: hypothetical protein IIC85_03535 [Chloroflexi bacterium]|nr:hypothetical protein [Chloroflexota bacterium]
MILVVRFGLGISLAFFLAAIVFVITRLLVVHVTPTTTLFSIGLGAGLGGALGWINPDSPKLHILFIITLGILGAIGGAWGGMLYGSTVYIMGGMPGIAEFSGLVRGAAIGGNIPPIVVGVIRIWRGGD